MTTALQYINRLRVMIRDEQVDTIETSDDVTQDLLIAFNDAKDTILNEHLWSFRKRDDGIASFPGKFSGTAFSSVLFSEVVTIDAVNLHTFFLGGSNSRFQLTNHSVQPNRSYTIMSANTVAGNTEFVLGSLWPGEAGAYTDPQWITFTYEFTLPTTVGNVLSVRDEENDKQIPFADKDIQIDRIYPRPQVTFGDAELVFVGGTSTTTSTTDYPQFENGTDKQKEIFARQSGITATRMVIWPPPTDTMQLQYSYVYVYPDVLETADALLGIPRNVEQIIIMQAFYALLVGNKEADVVRAKEVARWIELALAKAKITDKRDPLRRRIMRPNGSAMGMNPNSRWASREVPSA